MLYCGFRAARIYRYSVSGFCKPYNFRIHKQSNLIIAAKLIKRIKRFAVPVNRGKALSAAYHSGCYSPVAVIHHSHNRSYSVNKAEIISLVSENEVAAVKSVFGIPITVFVTSVPPITVTLYGEYSALFFVIILLSSRYFLYLCAIPL